MDIDYVEKILASPNAPQQINALNEAMQDEKKTAARLPRMDYPGHQS